MEAQMAVRHGDRDTFLADAANHSGDLKSPARAPARARSLFGSAARTVRSGERVGPRRQPSRRSRSRALGSAAFYIVKRNRIGGCELLSARDRSSAEAYERLLNFRSWHVAVKRTTLLRGGAHASRA
jgi:hypothetical protein